MPLILSDNPRGLTPREILDQNPALTIGQVAIVLQQFTGKGEPDRRAVRDLVRDGKLRFIDPDVGVTRQRISANLLRAYMGEDPIVAVTS